MMTLAGKRALVTGSTMGIGHAAARGLLEAGARVALHGRSRDRVQEEIDKLGLPGAVAVSGDIGSADDCRLLVADAIKQLGGLDYLVCNAGIGDLSYPEDVTEEHWDKVFN